MNLNVNDKYVDIDGNIYELKYIGQDCVSYLFTNSDKSEEFWTSIENFNYCITNNVLTIISEKTPDVKKAQEVFRKSVTPTDPPAPECEHEWIQYTGLNQSDDYTFCRKCEAEKC